MGDGHGPSKQLIPVIRPETPCPHEYGNEEGLTVEVDCEECTGAQDIESPRCFMGLIIIVMTGAAPRSIILRRHVHKRYRGEAVRRLLSVAEDLAAINRAIASHPHPSDRKCRTCPASMEKILGEVRRLIVKNPLTYASNPEQVSESILNASQGAICAEGRACVEEASSLLTNRVGLI